MPPFKPSRVVSEQFFERRDPTSCRRLDAPVQVHLDQPGTENRQRRVRELFPRTAFFWWSGQTQVNGRGSLMAYMPGESEHSGWYVESSRDGGWHDTDRLCISASELDVLVAEGLAR